LDEPKNTVFIDFASGGTFAKGKLETVVKLFGTYIRLAALHAPNDMPVFLNADGIAAVEVDKQYDGKCVAVVATAFENLRVPARNKIGLNETVEQAREAIESARRHEASMAGQRRPMSEVGDRMDSTPRCRQGRV
jgi:hypothetical protein